MIKPVVEEILGDLIHEGIVVTKYGHSVPLKKIKHVKHNFLLRKHKKDKAKKSK